MIFLVRQPSASAVGRGTSSFYGYLNYWTFAINELT
jgi:hypothetical protein